MDFYIHESLLGRELRFVMEELNPNPNGASTGVVATVKVIAASVPGGDGSIQGGVGKSLMDKSTMQHSQL